MPKTSARLRSSRRVPSLKDSEIDHEISLVDHSASIEELPSPTPGTGDDSNNDSNNNIDSSVSTQPPDIDVQPKHGAPSAEAGHSGGCDASQASAKDADSSMTGKEPTSKDIGLDKTITKTKPRPRPSKEAETAIDILYENQRGGFLCGIPLFSSAALGNLDPPPWTNFAHKPSPTDINTAQVPDPSWEWAWPEWRINKDETIDTDSDGWEYSFMFSKKFSWHGPKWYSSFVRRRTWIRMRIKKGHGYQMNDPYMSHEYFSVVSTRTESGRTSTNQLGARISQETSRKSRDTRRDEDEGLVMVDITTVEELMAVLRKSRIDRERLEAIENYIEHCADDMQQLQDYMHKIMSLFVFQTTRKLLLARLIQLHDSHVDKKQKGKSLATRQKDENLTAAIKHADEEVRRLEYWSDIKGMTESGESRAWIRAVQGV
ncbi:uncharacterized protein F4812DRAFT_429007 [Daldinia caldariorum]|uniref:uncharacterized protein n=1 Tax=Daldinia caldariorum TaxID=326644 RepID=UPI00200846EE|nr:uncharacterized protein F4812DRAFT_429007 [Daldinia caldariorum]KAI1468121.1 hypothetical protein F4812DRAFT_429007 [Daldinia caldariorum]